MATQNTTDAPQRGWGFRRTHAGFALAMGIGAGLLPPAGTLTLAGWLGGTLGAVVASLLVMSIALAVVRIADPWRPADVADGGVSDTAVRYLVFAVIALQLFLFGLGTSLRLSLTGMAFLAGGGNLLIAGAIALDMRALGGRNLEWDAAEYGFPLGALLGGFLVGLLYWRHRGRKRTNSSPPRRGAGHASAQALVGVGLAVTLVVGPVSGPALLTGAGPGAQQQPVCLESRVDDPSSEMGNLVGATIDSLPDAARDAMVGERISIRIDSSYYGIIVDEAGEIVDATTGQLDEPTIRARTDCDTVDRILGAESRADALRQAISNDDITWEGVGGAKNVQIAAGSKALQVYDIVTAEDSAGDVGDAGDGFQKGLSNTLLWPTGAA